MHNPQTIHIGFALNDLRNTFWATLGYGAREQALQSHVRLSLRSAATPEQQAEHIRQFTAQHVDVLIVAPIDNGRSPVITAAVQAAQAASIPLLTCEGAASGLAAHDVGADLYAAGTIAAMYLLGRLADGDALLHLQGDGSALRTQGFDDVLAQQPHGEVVAHAGNWTVAAGEQLTHAALAAHPNLRALFAHNDGLALGALSAIAAAGRTGEVIVVGVDAPGAVLGALHVGSMHAAIDLSPRMLGRTVVETAMQLAQGDVVHPQVWSTVTLVTRDTMIELMLDDMQLLPAMFQHILSNDATPG